MTDPKPPKLEDEPFLTIRDRLNSDKATFVVAIAAMVFATFVTVGALDSRKAPDWVKLPVLVAGVTITVAVQILLYQRLMRCPKCGVSLAKHLKGLGVGISYCPHCAASLDDECPQ